MNISAKFSIVLFCFKNQIAVPLECEASKLEIICIFKIIYQLRSRIGERTDGDYWRSWYFQASNILLKIFTTFWSIFYGPVFITVIFNFKNIFYAQLLSMETSVGFCARFLILFFLNNVTLPETSSCLTHHSSEFYH